MNVGLEYFKNDVSDSNFAVIYKQYPEADDLKDINIGSSIDLYFGLPQNRYIIMIKYLILFFVFFGNILSAQEIISNLISNPLLSKNKFVSNSNKSLLDLPFFDDFSYDSSIVNSELWEKAVYLLIEIIL